MKSLLLAILFCLVSTTSFGHYTNSGVPVVVEKIDPDTFGIMLAQSTIQVQVKTLIKGYLSEKQSEDALTALMEDIKTVLQIAEEKHKIFNASIEIDKEKFINNSIVSMKITFKCFPPTEQEAVLTFEFQIDWK